MENEKKTAVLQETGKFLIDIAKLVFGGIMLAGIILAVIMKYDSINQAWLFSIGGTTVLLCFIFGLILTAASKK